PPLIVPVSIGSQPSECNFLGRATRGRPIRDQRQVSPVALRDISRSFSGTDSSKGGLPVRLFPHLRNSTSVALSLGRCAWPIAVPETGAVVLSLFMISRVDCGTGRAREASAGEANPKDTQLHCGR